jgi:hypothetical protein
MRGSPYPMIGYLTKSMPANRAVPPWLAVKVVEPLTFGPDLVEVVADTTESAFGGSADAEPGPAVAAEDEKREVTRD